VPGFGGNSTALEVARGADLKGKVSIVTGATAGIGLHTVVVLASLGATVYATARNLEKASKIPELQHPNIKISHLDLNQLKTVEAFAKSFKQKHDHVDHLILNAGSVEEGGKTEDGFGVPFQSNHLASHLLTRLLADVIGKKGSSRIVLLSSMSYTSSPEITEAVLKRFSVSSTEGLGAYSISKLLNILMAKGFNERFKNEGINATANALHPGNLIKTEIGKRAITKFLITLVSPFTKSIAQGTATTILVALAPELEGVGGLMFNNCHEIGLTPVATNPKSPGLLYEFSENLIKSRL